MTTLATQPQKFNLKKRSKETAFGQKLLKEPHHTKPTGKTASKTAGKFASFKRKKTGSSSSKRNFDQGTSQDLFEKLDAVKNGQGASQKKVNLLKKIIKDTKLVPKESSRPALYQFLKTLESDGEYALMLSGLRTKILMFHHIQK